MCREDEARELLVAKCPRSIQVPLQQCILALIVPELERRARLGEGVLDAHRRGICESHVRVLPCAKEDARRERRVLQAEQSPGRTDALRGEEAQWGAEPEMEVPT